MSKNQTKHPLPTCGRDPLNWIVVNPDGKLLAILDSESEAYWFTRNRGHAEGAVYFKAPMDYATAPELLEALKDVLRHCVTVAGMPDKGNGRTQEQQTAYDKARAAIAKAEGKE